MDLTSSWPLNKVELERVLAEPCILVSQTALTTTLPKDVASENMAFSTQFLTQKLVKKLDPGNSARFPGNSARFPGNSARAAVPKKHKIR